MGCVGSGGKGPKCRLGRRLFANQVSTRCQFNCVECQLCLGKPVDLIVVERSDSLQYNGSMTKSYQCVQLNTGAGTQLSKIASLPVCVFFPGFTSHSDRVTFRQSTWNYQVTQRGFTWDLDFNVAYDFFTGSTPNLTVGAPHTNEIMIWTSVHYMVPVTERDPVTNKPIYLAQKLRLPGIIGNYSWFVLIVILYVAASQ